MTHQQRLDRARRRERRRSMWMLAAITLAVLACGLCVGCATTPQDSLIHVSPGTQLLIGFDEIDRRGEVRLGAYDLWPASLYR